MFTFTLISSIHFQNSYFLSVHITLLKYELQWNREMNRNEIRNYGKPDKKLYKANMNAEKSWMVNWNMNFSEWLEKLLGNVHESLWGKGLRSIKLRDFTGNAILMSSLVFLKSSQGFIFRVLQSFALNFPGFEQRLIFEATKAQHDNNTTTSNTLLLSYDHVYMLC